MIFDLNLIFIKVSCLLSVLKKYPLFLWAVFVLGLGMNSACAQSDKGTRLTAGVEIKSLIPVSFFTPDPVVLREPNGNFVAEYTHQVGMGFGGIIRVKFSEFWNLETGIYYIRRKIEYHIEDQSVGFSATSPMRIIGYEIPVKGLVYIQMDENLFMDVALGVSADFFASDTEVRVPNYDIVTFKKNWIKAAVLGNVGVEYRTDDNGTFYFGATFHKPFGDIMSTQVNYLRDGTPPFYFRNGTIDGTYFSIDFRYFFPLEKPSTNKVNYVIPDWDDM